MSVPPTRAMGQSFLEVALGGACPSFAPEWQRLRATYGTDEPSAADFLGALRAHLHVLLLEGRIAEVTRLLYAVERLLGDADPILEALLADELVAPLAGESATLGLDPRLLLPHLGPRTRAVWGRGSR